MKTKTLLASLAHFMNKDLAAQREERAQIREVLKKLKKKEKQLREKLEADLDDEERRELEGKLDIVHAQRIKGLERVQKIRASRRLSAGAKVSEP